MHVIVTLLKELLSGWKINQSTTPQGCISLTFSRGAIFHGPAYNLLHVILLYTAA